ncbi:MAG: EamA family transporter [Rubrobacter sp.]|nr:EamA family transporter [Rubrobacter sp.]
MNSPVLQTGPGEGPAGSLLVLAAAVLWGTTGTALALAPAGADPVSVGAVRISVGGAALVAFAAWRGGMLPLGRWPLAATAAAAAGVAAYQPFFFAGVSRTGVAVGTVVAIGSAPVMAGLVGFLFRGERPGPRWAAATVLAVLGCGLLVGVGGGSAGVDALGVLSALGAGLSYGAYATASKNLLDHRLPQAAVMAAAFGLGGILLSPVLLFSDLGWLGEPGGVAAALHLGLVATAAAYLLFVLGLAGIPVATAATLSLAEPLTAGLLGVLLLGERLGPVALAGAGLLLFGLLLAAGPRRRVPA